MDNEFIHDDPIRKEKEILIKKLKELNYEDCRKECKYDIKNLDKKPIEKIVQRKILTDEKTLEKLKVENLNNKEKLNKVFDIEEKVNETNDEIKDLI